MNINTEIIASQLIELIKNNETFKENFELKIFQNDPNSLYSLIEEQLELYITEPVQILVVKELESFVFNDSNLDFDDDIDPEDSYYE